MDTINFYRRNEPFGEFSNFAKFPISIGNKTWPTSEHYYQAQKFEDVEYQERIRLEPNPRKARDMGQIKDYGFKTNWDELKENMMRIALWSKFTQYKDLYNLLLSTEDAVLAEHTTNDKYWGDGGDGSGKNRLGHLLMELRSLLKIQQL